MNLSAGVVMGLTSKFFRDRRRSFPDAVYVSLCVQPDVQSRPASRATTDGPEAPRACECCQTQASLESFSLFVENFVSPCFSLHSHFTELARCYAPVTAVSINPWAVSTNTPAALRAEHTCGGSMNTPRAHKFTRGCRVFRNYSLRRNAGLSFATTRRLGENS